MGLSCLCLQASSCNPHLIYHPIGHHRLSESLRLLLPLRLVGSLGRDDAILLPTRALRRPAAPSRRRRAPSTAPARCLGDKLGGLSASHPLLCHVQRLAGLLKDLQEPQRDDEANREQQTCC